MSKNVSFQKQVTGWKTVWEGSGKNVTLHDWVVVSEDDHPKLYNATFTEMFLHLPVLEYQR